MYEMFPSLPPGLAPIPLLSEGDRLKDSLLSSPLRANLEEGKIW